MIDPCFISFKQEISTTEIPLALNNPFESTTPLICKIAASELQGYLQRQTPDWTHNFGTDSEKEGLAKGKMFGVLVVRNAHDELGYLAAFSGKIADESYPSIFVPSVFDVSTDDFFINKGMLLLTQISNEINTLETSATSQSRSKIADLKKIRKAKSAQLQQQLFDHYQFMNQQKDSRNLCEIFQLYNSKKPPSAAGECAAPKLLQYAFQHNMKPLAIAEFWWGQSPKSEIRIHGEFYTSCNDKCRPILSYMLEEKF
jgi:tRNA pseudouridine32 synthase/23S rRNA pseudouridine746 synthase